MKFIARNDGFICNNCHKQVEPIKWGGSYRNHCPFCLYSKHVDGAIPGDRANDCLGVMRAVGVVSRRTGEFVLIHKCQKCGFERRNRIAGDDDFDKITKLQDAKF
ncbi:MAG: RNHCP domain-containing protein [Patescibacteria group bacterium]